MNIEKTENTSGLEIGVKENFMKNAENRGDKVLVFSDHGDVVFDKDGFDYTMITDAKLVMDGKIIPLEKTNTWAGLLRSVNKVTKPQRDKEDVAEECFNGVIAEVVEKYGLGMNRNFSMELFDDDSFMNSSVYKNNQNHALNVWRGKKICAVYAGEVVVVLNALIGSSGSTITDGEVYLLVSYCRREPNLKCIDPVEKRKIQFIVQGRVKNSLYGKFDNISSFNMAYRKSLSKVYKEIENRNISSAKELECIENKDIFNNIINTLQIAVGQQDEKAKNLEVQLEKTIHRNTSIEKVRKALCTIKDELEAIEMYLEEYGVAGE